MQLLADFRNENCSHAVKATILMVHEIQFANQNTSRTLNAGSPRIGKARFMLLKGSVHGILYCRIPQETSLQGANTETDPKLVRTDELSFEKAQSRLILTLNKPLSISLNFSS